MSDVANLFTLNYLFLVTSQEMYISQFVWLNNLRENQPEEETEEQNWNGLLIITFLYIFLSQYKNLIRKIRAIFFYLLTMRNASATPLQSMAKIKEKVLLITRSNSCESTINRANIAFAAQEAANLKARGFLSLCARAQYIFLLILYR